MYNELGSFQVPTTLKQLETSLPDPNDKKINNDDQTGNLFESFGNVLKEKMEETNNVSFEAHKAQEAFATGGNISLHEVIIKTHKAEMAMQLTMKMRNKLVEAYKEIQNIRV